jgi:hypothetical protein
MLKSYFCADAFLREYLEEKGMRDTAVNDMDLGAAGIKGLEAGFGFWKHAAGDDSGTDEPCHLLLVQRGDEVLPPVKDARLVRKQNKFLGLQRTGNSSRYKVGINIIGFTPNTDTDGSDHRNEAALLKRDKSARSDFRYLADKSDIYVLGFDCVPALFRHF